MPKLKQEKINPRIIDILKLLGFGVLLSAIIIAPSLARLAILLKDSENKKWGKDRKEWDKFKSWRLKQLLKRLQQQRDIEIRDGLVKITEKGRVKLLKFDLETIKLKEEMDGKWRLILYDIANLRKPQRELFRAMLKKLKLLKIQKSVYITPFICDEEIEYLRQVFNINDEVQIMQVSKLENEDVYKKYFGI